MRVIYVPGNERQWAHYYHSQALQHGSGFAAALPYQRGSGLGSLFKGIFRAILPVAKSVGKNVGRQALQTGTEIAADVLAGKSIKDAAQERGKIGASKLLNKASKNLQPRRKNKKKKQQQGSGLGIRNSSNKKKTTRAPTTIKRGGGGGKRRRRKRVEDQLGFYFK